MRFSAIAFALLVAQASCVYVVTEYYTHDQGGARCAGTLSRVKVMIEDSCPTDELGCTLMNSDELLSCEDTEPDPKSFFDSDPLMAYYYDDDFCSNQIGWIAQTVDCVYDESADLSFYYECYEYYGTMGYMGCYEMEGCSPSMYCEYEDVDETYPYFGEPHAGCFLNEEFQYFRLDCSSVDNLYLWEVGSTFTYNDTTCSSGEPIAQYGIWTRMCVEEPCDAIFDPEFPFLLQCLNQTTPPARSKGVIESYYGDLQCADDGLLWWNAQEPGCYEDSVYTNYYFSAHCNSEKVTFKEICDSDHCDDCSSTSEYETDFCDVVTGLMYQCDWDAAYHLQVPVLLMLGLVLLWL
ncbi:hypothetical protein Pelo_13454 [Pelomyxa schiedti]|nr:hypothetical protein Pelo_13454 [Pelomyxa schiedti]